jgi:acetylornithine deacetylase/succinyl-diaminopimelate desuccinylase-like protein
MTDPAAQALTDETVKILQDLIRLNTSNPPGNESLAANFVAHILHQNGIEPTVIEMFPGRGNVVARLKGNGNAAPLLLYSHTDVVPVEREKWSVDPFGGVIKNGYVYGRGALDMKGIGAAQLAVFLAIARAVGATHASPLQRDIIFAMTADEETDTNQGIGPLTDAHPELLRAEYALSEFGGFSMYVGNKCFYPIQTAEKGTAWMRMIARGKPGHASVPHSENAVVYLARAVDKIGRAKLPMHMTATAQHFIGGLADGLGGAQGAALRALASSGMNEFALDAVLRDSNLLAELRAVTHNTVSPTGLKAGMKTNVIPSEATAVLDCRTLPGFDGEKMIEELEAVLGDDARHISFELDSESPPAEFDFNTPLYKFIATKLKQHDPAAIPVPMMMTGATDAKHLIKLGTKCYGFSPMKFKPGEHFAELVHGHDERVAIESLAWGVRVLHEVVAEFCG